MIERNKDKTMGFFQKKSEMVLFANCLNAENKFYGITDLEQKLTKYRIQLKPASCLLDAPSYKQTLHYK